VICTAISLVGLEFVQQPCSNPSKYPETLRKAPYSKYGDLQAFCKLQKSPATYRAAFTRQRSLVRNQHRPLLNLAFLQEKHKSAKNSAEKVHHFVNQ
jgi:hypothetical protein